MLRPNAPDSRCIADCHANPCRITSCYHPQCDSYPSPLANFIVIIITLPLAILGGFIGMACLRSLGIANLQTNIMSLAGIIISIGVLVDSSIVIVDNVTHRLKQRFGDQPIRGDVTWTIAQASAEVAWPACLATILMIITFLPYSR